MRNKKRPAGRAGEACIDEDAKRVSDVTAPHARRDGLPEADHNNSTGYSKSTSAELPRNHSIRN